MTTRSRIKTEHTGAKNGGGYWGRCIQAKAESRVKRRHDDQAEVEERVDDMDSSEIPRRPKGGACARAAMGAPAERSRTVAAHDDRFDDERARQRVRWIGKEGVFVVARHGDVEQNDLVHTMTADAVTVERCRVDDVHDAVVLCVQRVGWHSSNASREPSPYVESAQPA